MRFSNLDKQTKKDGGSYDPRKYVRGYQLLNGVNINELPNIKLNEEANKKYSYEDYMKNKSLQPTNLGNFDPNSNNQNQNKYSYEQYLQNKNNVNNKVNPNNNSNVYSPPQFRTFNENYNDVSLNFDINQGKQVNDLRTTTILPDKNTVDNQTQEGDYNPYSMLSFDNNTQNLKNISQSYNYGMGNQSNQVNQMNWNQGNTNYRPSNSMMNQPQFPGNNSFNLLSSNNNFNNQMNPNMNNIMNQNFNNQMNPNVNNNFPNINKYPNNDMKFPR
jgi:hypothetical protein